MCWIYKVNLEVIRINKINFSQLLQYYSKKKFIKFTTHTL